MSSTFGAAAIKYDVRQGAEYNFECKYSLYTEADPLNTEQRNPTNRSLVKIEITKETVIESNLNASIGDVTAKIWYLAPGSTWELAENSWILPLSYDASSTSETENLHTNVSLSDATVTKANIVSFFKSSAFLIPVGLSEAQKENIGIDIRNRLTTAYGSAPESARTANSLNFTFSKIGSNQFNLNVQYSETDGSLLLWELVSSTDSKHIIFRVEQLVPNTNVPKVEQQVDGFSIPIFFIGITLAVAVLLKKKTI